MAASDMSDEASPSSARRRKNPAVDGCAWR
jgi:hypothetical protein